MSQEELKSAKVSIDVGDTLANVKRLNAEIRSLVGNIAQLGKPKSLANLASELKRVSELAQTQRRTMAEIHAGHEQVVAEHITALKNSALNRDNQVIYNTTHDKWEREAERARERYKSDVAKGVDPETAQRALDDQIASIRAERERAHQRKLEQEKRKAAQPTPTQSVLSAIKSQDETIDQRKEQRIDDQAVSWIRKGADPNAVANWKADALKKLQLQQTDQQAKANDQLVASEYRSHQISIQEYRAYLQTRLADFAQFSTRWNNLNSQIQVLDQKIAKDDKAASRTNENSPFADAVSSSVADAAEQAVRRKSGVKGFEGDLSHDLKSEFTKVIAKEIGSEIKKAIGDIKLLPSTLGQIRTGFSGLISTLTQGFNGALVGVQSLLALSGVEGKKRQKHSLFGGILGGIAGSFVGNWFGGFETGSALGGLFASGGQMDLSKYNIVGERGPELVAPGGLVVPLRGGQPKSGQPGMGGNTSITINHYGDIHGGDDMQRMYDQLPMFVANALPTAKAGV